MTNCSIPRPRREPIVIIAGLLAWAIAGLAVADSQPVRRVMVTGTVVDEAGKPVSGVEVTAVTEPASEPSKTAADGVFHLSSPVSPMGRIFTAITARSDDGRLGVKMLSRNPNEPGEPLSVVLKPARTVKVRAVDGVGKGVEGASIHFLMGFHQLAEGTTDSQGDWSTQVAADAVANSWVVYGYRSKTGFDYAQAERERGSQQPPLALPEVLTLTLDGASPPLQVKAVDKDGKGVADVRVGPWLIHKPNHPKEMNGMRATFVATDKDGFATFDWLPALVKGKRSFVSSSDDYYPPDNAIYIDEEIKSGQVATIAMLPKVRLAGHIFTADHRPAEGALVRIQGQGGGNNGFHGEAETDSQGRYSLMVYADQAYLVNAIRADDVATYPSDLIVKAGKPADGIDLILRKGTRVRGRVTVGNVEKPAADVYIQARMNKGNIPQELKREGDRTYRGLELRFSKRTDAEGRYEFLLAPGEYIISGPARAKPVNVSIPAVNPPLELVNDFKMPRPESGPFRLKIVDDQGKPVAGAVVQGAYQAPTAWFNPMVADAEGVIKCDRSLDPLILMAATPDRSRGAIEPFDAETTEGRMVLKPTASANGRLLDSEGKALAGVDLSYGIRVHLGPSKTSPFSWFFGGSKTTNDQGDFEVNGLVVGQPYEFHVNGEGRGRYVDVNGEPVKPVGADTIALGNLKVDLTPLKPYIPPTATEKTETGFAARKDKTVKERFEALLPEARREYTRPLLLFGNAKDPACIALFEAFDQTTSFEEATAHPEQAKTPGDLRWEFELLSLDASKADVKTFAKDLGVSIEEKAPPTLAMLSESGRLMESFPLLLNAEGKLDIKALGAFLAKHKLKTRDAEAMLADGIAEAKAEKKRVFLITSASWCGPCRLLARYLDANHAVLDPHFVFVTLDVSRDRNAEAVRERYKGKDTAGGVPWYVILDDQGKALITSNAPESRNDPEPQNIGFPSQKHGIDHFLGMLKQTAPAISEETLASLRRKLETSP